MALRPSPHLAAARHLGDPVADRLAAWILARGPHIALPLFERVLALGLDEVPEAPPEVKDFFKALENIPDWVQPQRLMHGARACHVSGRTALRVLRDVVLPGACLPPAAGNPLFRAETLTATAQRLVAETSQWWLHCTAPGGLSRFAAGFKSTVRARLTNALTRQEARAPGRLPANQAELQAVYLGCSVGMLTGQRLLGVPINTAEAEAAMHLWRYIGWLMGVSEELLCDSEAQAREALADNLAQQPPLDASTLALGRALLDEPLARHNHRGNAWFTRWAGQAERAAHLGVAGWVLGPEALAGLGWPTGMAPWPVLLLAPRNLLRHAVWALMPGARRHLACAGRADQEAALAALMGRLHPSTHRPGRLHDWGVVLSPSGLRPPPAAGASGRAASPRAAPSRARSA